MIGRWETFSLALDWLNDNASNGIQKYNLSGDFDCIPWTMFFYFV